MATRNKAINWLLSMINRFEKRFIIISWAVIVVLMFISLWLIVFTKSLLMGFSSHELEQVIANIYDAFVKFSEIYGGI